MNTEWLYGLVPLTLPGYASAEASGIQALGKFAQALGRLSFGAVQHSTPRSVGRAVCGDVQP